jgi:uncharacterized protein HemY
MSCPYDTFLIQLYIICAVPLYATFFTLWILSIIFRIEEGYWPWKELNKKNDISKKRQSKFNRK